MDTQEETDLLLYKLLALLLPPSQLMVLITIVMAESMKN
jgi:hypothetical protein